MTRGRHALLLRKLDSLLAQTLAPEHFEWIVCVNGADAGSLRALEAATPPFSLEVTECAVPISISAARNLCAARARAPTLYLSDDDCLLEPDTLARHLGAQQRSPCVAVGSISFEHQGRARLWRPRKVHYWNVNGANTSLPRAAFAALGGFDERLRGYGGEDVLLGYRLAARGLPVVALPAARVRHLGPDPMRSGDANKAFQAGRNAVRIARLEPGLAWRLGVHGMLLALKQLAVLPPLGWLWRKVDEASYTYERAYLAGAREERRHE